MNFGKVLEVGANVVQKTKEIIEFNEPHPTLLQPINGWYQNIDTKKWSYRGYQGSAVIEEVEDPESFSAKAKEVWKKTREFLPSNSTLAVKPEENFTVTYPTKKPDSRPNSRITHPYHSKGNEKKNYGSSKKV